MEFLTTKQKKKKARRLFVGYALLSVLISLATYVLVSTALGFEVFSARGEVVQNGLLFIDSRPDNAEIYINGRKESNNTNAKFTVPEAEYSIELKKSGYHDWSGKVSLRGGTVEFLTYPRLMPTTPILTTSRSLISTPLTSQSRDKRWVASYTKEIPNSIEIIDLDKPKDPIVTLPIPASVTANKPIQSMEFVDWAGDNEHFMIGLRLADTPAIQYVIMHREKAEEITNVSTVYSLSAGDSSGFWDAKKDRVFVKQASGAILIGNLKDKSISAQSLFTDLAIEFFPVDKERALYTTKIGEEVVLRYYNDQKTYTITTIKHASKPVIAKLFGFNRNEYILVAGEAFDKTYIYKNFEETAKDSPTGKVAPFFTMPAQSKIAETSRSSRFVMGSDGVNAQVYDIEEKEFIRYELPSSKPADIGWFDDVRLYSIGADLKLSVFDFTGNNVYVLASNVQSKPLVNDGVSMASYILKDSNQFTMNFIDIDSASQ